MSFNIFTTPNFDREIKGLAKHYKSMKADFGEFKDSLKENPFQGTVVMEVVTKLLSKSTLPNVGFLLHNFSACRDAVGLGY